uniref:Uncharacterized protein n=1 Tax=Catagonus wagneri TaxID=51154 RepID=A0A8C3WU04_9CETA
MAKQSKEAKQKLQQLYKGGHFAIHWDFAPPKIYLGFKGRAHILECLNCFEHTLGTKDHLVT